ncbi:triose-phosphate isomerase [Chloroflexota bacterium]
MRIPMIVGNWKMNTTAKEAVEFVQAIREDLNKIANVEKVICPPFVSLVLLRDIIKNSSIKLGAQNVFYEEKGAYTGEISPLMLVDLCEFVIIGHSERRQYFYETVENINKKIQAVLQAGLKPILCIGENLEENETGKTKSVVTEQLRSSLANVSNINVLTIAYEPIWAIGTGKAATGEQTNETIGLIRHNISQLYDTESAENALILYGGSVTADNVTEFIQQPEIDGALVGGASLKAEQFVNIVKRTSEIRSRR